MDVDAVEQRAGNLGDVALDLGGVHLQSRVASLKWPHGQGFIAATSMKLDGKVSDMAARLIVTR